MSSIIRIHTPSLFLRKFVVSDVPKVFQMSLEPGMRRWIPDQVYRDEEHTTKVIEQLMVQYDDMESPALAPYVFGICLKTTGELIGHVGLSPCQNQSEIGYAIEDKHQSRGYATEAVKAMTKWGHEVLGLSTVLGVVASENVGSCIVLEKAGYLLAKEEEGTLHGRQGLIRTYVSRYVVHQHVIFS